MDHWGILDWIAFSSIWLAAIISAADVGLKMAPELRSRLKWLVDRRLWGLLPLFLMFVATPLLVVQALKSPSLELASNLHPIGGQPEISFLPPLDRYEFKWDVDHDMRLAVRRDGETNPDFTQNPAFILKNTSQTIAYDVTVSWRPEVSGLKELAKSSPRSNEYIHELTDDRLLLFPRPNTPVSNFMYYLAPTATQSFALVAKEAEVYLPIQLWPLAALYLVNQMPNEVGVTTPPFLFFVSVVWKVPDGNNKLDYRVRVTATNSKPTNATTPYVASRLNFSVEKIN